MKLCAFHAWLPNTFWLSDFHKVCVCIARVCVCTYINCASLAMKNLHPQLFYPFAQKREKEHHTVGVPLYQLPPPAFLQVAFAKVVLLISNIFDFQCEIHCPRPPPTPEKKGMR